MELPKLNDMQSIPKLRCQALEAILPAKNAIRGQYQGYRKEVGNPKSNVETFVSLQLESTEPRWKGVPITITTGKELNDRFTEIRVSYHGEGNTDANILILRIQPDEGVQVCLWVKKPGYDNQLQQIPLSFEYRNHFNDKLPEAYERVFVDAMRSDHTLFTTSEEVLASWKILAPVQAAWAEPAGDLKIYQKGSAPQDVINAR